MNLLAIHEFIRGHSNPNRKSPSTHDFSRGSNIIPSHSILTREFIRGSINPYRQSLSTHDFYHGFQKRS